MQFGLFYEWPNPTLRHWKLLFEEGVQQIQYSEALGFDYCLIAEHHFTNYGNSSAPREHPYRPRPFNITTVAQ